MGYRLAALAALLALSSAVASSQPGDCVITSTMYAGGAVADNLTTSTAQIQAAIDDCHAAHPAGARVVVPRGAFRTGSLMLRSNLELHLEAGAGLYGSDDWAAYPIVPGLPFGTMFRALISGYNLTNVKITGSNLAVPVRVRQPAPPQRDCQGPFQETACDRRRLVTLRRTRSSMALGGRGGASPATCPSGQFRIASTSTRRTKR